MSRILLVIPAYNEQDNIEQIVLKSLQICDVCVVNDASKDETGKLIEALSIALGQKSMHKLYVLHHLENTHIPRSIQDGMALAAKKDYDYVITMDAGGSHNPNELTGFIEHPDCDLIVGFRQKKTGVPLYRAGLSMIGTFTYNAMLSRTKFGKLKDCTSGYRRYSKSIYKEIISRKLLSRSFDFHLEAIFIAEQKGMTIKEIPISYKYTNSSLKPKTVLDAIRFILLAKKIRKI